jgi:hypothetical protein
MVLHGSNPSYLGDGDRRIGSWRPTQVKRVRPCLKSKIKAKRLRNSSSGRVLAYYSQSWRLNLQYVGRGEPSAKWAE